MKKLCSVLLTLYLVLSLSACGSNNSTADNSTTVSVSQSKTEITDTNSSWQSTDTSSSATHSSSDSDSTDSPCSATSKPTTTIAQETVKPITTAHTHSFTSVTCTAPAKCSCGAVNGSALGHVYSNPNCTSPKKCSRCGITEGNALGHNYSNGVCSRCGITKVSDSDSGLIKGPDSIHDWFDDEVNEQVYVTETTYVYLAPGTEYGIIGTLNKGDVVTRTSHGKIIGWNRIEYNGQRAYVDSSCLSTKDPSFIAAEAHGFNIGDVITMTNSQGVSYTLQYLGEDRWEDQNGTIWTSYEKDDGSLHFTSFGVG